MSVIYPGPRRRRDALEIGDYVALVLDLDLQSGDGLAVLREIRQREDPIAVITISARNSVHDRINVASRIFGTSSESCC